MWRLPKVKCLYLRFLFPERPPTLVKIFNSYILNMYKKVASFFCNFESFLDREMFSIFVGLKDIHIFVTVPERRPQAPGPLASRSGPRPGHSPKTRISGAV
jgi:hypothetical protein